MKLSIVVLYLLCFTVFSSVTAKHRGKNFLRKFHLHSSHKRGPLPPQEIPNNGVSNVTEAPYNSTYLSDFATGAGLSITGEVGDNDVSGCISSNVLKTSDYGIEQETIRQLTHLNGLLRQLNRIVFPAMRHTDLFCFHRNKEHLIMSLEEVLGTKGEYNYLPNRDVLDFGGEIEGRNSTKNGKGKGKEMRNEPIFDQRLGELLMAAPFGRVKTTPYWKSHFNNFFTFNLNILRMIRNTLMEIFGSDLAIEYKTFLTCVQGKKNKESRSYNAIARSFDNILVLESSMKGFVNVLVNSICNWSNYRLFNEHLENGLKETDESKKFTLFGRAIGELTLALGLPENK